MSNDNVSSHSSQNMPPPTQSLYRGNSLNTTSYLNDYSNHYTSRTDHSIHIKQNDESHGTNYNLTHLKIPTMQNTSARTVAKYTTQLPQQNLSNDKKNFFCENYLQQSQIYTTYSTSQLNSSSTQIIHSSPTQRLVRQQSPQTLQKQTPIKEIDSLSSTIPINHNQSNPQSELAQQLSAPPAVPIQQSLSIQNTAFQIQSRPGLMKGILKPHQIAYSSQESSSKSQPYSPQSPAIQVVNHHSTYIPSSLSQQSQSSTNRLTSDGSNTHLLRNNNNVEDSSQSYYSQELRQQPSELYNTQQHLNLQNSQQSQQHVNSVVINDNGIVQPQYYQSRNVVQHIQPNNQIANKLIQTAPLSSGLSQNHNSLTSNNSSQRIYVQHHQLNNTAQNQNLQLQQNKQTHYMTVPVTQQQKFQNVRQSSQQVLISGNNLIPSQQQPSNLLQTSQQIVSNYQPTSNTVQNSSIYIGSQRFYSNSVIAAAAISNSPASSSYGDGTLIASAPPLSNLSSISITELISASDISQPKKMYRNLKKKFKYLVYENEYYQEELRNLQRKLLKLSRDKNFLLDRLGSYETLSDSSDDSDASVKTIEDRSTKIRKKSKLSNNNSRKKTTTVNVINGSGSILNNTILNNNYTPITKRGCSMTISAAPPLPTSTIFLPISTENSKIFSNSMQNSLLSNNNVSIHYQQPPGAHKQNIIHSEKRKQFYLNETKPSSSSPNSSANFNVEDYSISPFNLPQSSVNVSNNQLFLNKQQQISKRKSLTNSNTISTVKGLYVNSLVNENYSKSNQPIEIQEFQNKNKVIVSSAAPPSTTNDNKNDQNNSNTYIEKFCDNENTVQQKNN